MHVLFCIQRAREALAAVPPQELFRKQTDKFSQFDEQGIPTHNAQGDQITDSQKKKFRKQWQAQERKHREQMSKK
jgi:cysteinyl-tRNA synthetase